MRPDARPQVQKLTLVSRFTPHVSRFLEAGRERRRWLRIGRRSRTVYVGQAPNSANRVLFMAGLVHRRASRVVRESGPIDLPLRDFLIPRYWKGVARMPSTARIERYTCSLQLARSRSRGGGRTVLLLRASQRAQLRQLPARFCEHRRSQPGSLLPRGSARSASKEGTWSLPSPIS